MEFLTTKNPTPIHMILYILILVWGFIWKGIALWRAAKSEQKWWFIAMLIVNSAGILELIYLFQFAKHKLTFKEIKSWYPKKK